MELLAASTVARFVAHLANYHMYDCMELDGIDTLHIDVNRLKGIRS